MFKEQVYWKDGFDEDVAQGGIFFRVVDLIKFISSLESRGDEVVGFKFIDNNIEIIINSHDNNKEK
jgi:hypothetical protein